MVTDWNGVLGSLFFYHHVDAVYSLLFLAFGTLTQMIYMQVIIRHLCP